MQQNSSALSQARNILNKTREGWNISPQRITWALIQTGDLVVENPLMMQNQPRAISHDLMGDHHGIWQRQGQETPEAISSTYDR